MIYVKQLNRLEISKKITNRSFFINQMQNESKTVSWLFNWIIGEYDAIEFLEDFYLLIWFSTSLADQTQPHNSCWLIVYRFVNQ